MNRSGDLRNPDAGSGEPAAVQAGFQDMLSAVLGPETARVVVAREGEDAGFPTPEARVLDRVNRRELLRQTNIERILRLAAADMPSSRPQQEIGLNWLSRFFEGAAEACSEPEQEVWARLLAREFAVPGSFAKRTLAFLNGMDGWELDAFAEYCAFAFSFESGWRFMFDEEFARREMWSYGRELDLTQHFVNIGLLSAETGRVRPASARGLRIRYLQKIYELEAGDGQVVDAGFAYRKFSSIGQQLAELVRTKSFYGYARNLMKTLKQEQGIEFRLLETTEGT